MEDMCRACLKSNVSSEYQFYKNVLPDLYHFCTSITIHEEETLPKTLCKSCHNSLLNYCNFKKTCLHSQSTLLQKYSSKLEGDAFIQDLSQINIQAQSLVPHEVNHTLLKKEHIKEENVTQWDNDTDVVDLDCADTKTKRRLKNKVKTVGKLFMYKCKQCKKKFKHKEIFEAHTLEHDGKTVNKSCPICNKHFITWSGLRRHNESEHSVVKLKSLKCTFCGKIFKNKQTLKMHKALHGPKKYVNICNVCGKSLSSSISLQNHLETHTENREKNYACEHCGKKFFTYRTLKSHLSRTHVSAKKFICHICNYPFSQKYNLANHLMIHEGKKAFKCEICSKTFSRQSSLMEHKRSHSGERPFHCEYCPKSFASKRWLIDHHKIHTGEKSHKCEICSQCFTQRGTLVRHMKIHKKLDFNCN